MTLELELITKIVEAYVSHNQVPAADLPELFRTVAAALSGLNGAPAGKPTPAVPVNKSVSEDFIVCLEDGKNLRTLKRYLRRFQMTPEQYRAKWGLPRDYPFVAPSYSALRSQFAKDAGLGRGGRTSRAKA